MFASKSIAEHAARGLAGFGLIVAAGLLFPKQPLVALIATAIAVMFLRGCPMCWTIGLVETIASKISGRRRAADTRPVCGRWCRRAHQPGW